MTIRVLVINLNNKSYTETCINSLLNQKFNNFKITLYDQNSNEFGTETMLNSFLNKGIDVVKNKTNDPVNSVWNWFYKTYTEDILCFLNNDVLIYDNFISDVLHVFNNEPNVGIAVHSTNHNDYTVKKETTEYQIVEPKKFMQGWDFSIRRDVFTLIPKELKTYCGDDFLFHNLYEKEFDLAYITSSPMIHFEGQSKPHMIHGGVVDIQKYLELGLPHYLKINTEFSNIKPTKIFITNNNHILDIVAVTYGQTNILKCFINSIKSQTNNNWRLFLIHDGKNEELRLDLETNGYLTSNIFFIEYPERTMCYGHILRKWALENLVTNEYVLITNGDNYYTPNMVNEVLNKNEDLIYFDCVHSHENISNHNKSSYGHMNCILSISNIDMGCVAVKTNIAKSVGFNTVGYAADWDYFNNILKTNPSIIKIDKILFVHN